MPKHTQTYGDEDIKPILIQKFGSKAYESWLKFLRFEEISGGRVYLAVPSRFLRDWISSRYGEQLLAIYKQKVPIVYSIEIIVKNDGAGVGMANEMTLVPANESKEAGPQDSTEGDATDAPQTSEAAAFDARYDFENFVVGKPNELAYAAARRVAESEAVYFNPLFLHGGVGLGKTHLMHAIARYIHEHQPERKVLYLSAEQFMYRFVRALRQKDMLSFRDQFRSVDVLMIDDVQFISGKESTQEEFFHTFNALIDKKRQIVLSADKSPSQLPGLQERVRSRLGWGLVVDIHPTTYELRLGILSSRVEGLDIQVPEAVLEFLAHKITSNIRELEGALNRVVAHATLVGQKITVESTELLLRDLLQAHQRQITIEEIQKTVAEHYNIRVADMHSNRRVRTVARPRQVAMYLSKKLTQKSLPDIGRQFGGRDHTTVMHAVKKVDALMETDGEFRDDVNVLTHILQK